MLANTRLVLSVQIVTLYLQQLHYPSSLANFHEESNLVKVSLVDERNRILINIVGVGLEPSKAMISLYQNETSLGQAIMDYKTDLLMDNVSFPIEAEEFLKSRKDQILATVNSKFKLPSSQESRQIPATLGTTAHEGSPESIPSNIPSSSNRESHGRPADMPDFDDEYQVREGQRVMSRPQLPLQGYGDSDLYPLGRSNPLMAEPFAISPSGGMILDPTQDAARRRQTQDLKTRGPGFMPGTRWDDPFGPAGPGPGGFGPGGFGPGGVI